MGFNIGNIVSKAKSGLKKVDNIIMKPPNPEDVEHRKRVKEEYTKTRRESDIKNARKRAQIDADIELKGYREKAKTGQNKGGGGMFSGFGKVNPAEDFGMGNPFGDEPKRGKGKGRNRKESDPFKGLM